MRYGFTRAKQRGRITSLTWPHSSQCTRIRAILVRNRHLRTISEHLWSKDLTQGLNIKSSSSSLVHCQVVTFPNQFCLIQLLWGLSVPCGVFWTMMLHCWQIACLIACLKCRTPPPIQRPCNCWVKAIYHRNGKHPFCQHGKGHASLHTLITARVFTHTISVSCLQ